MVWLPYDRDFERIDVDVQLHRDGHFVLAPFRAYLRGRRRAIELEKPLYPLSFNGEFQSRIWRQHLHKLRLETPDDLEWCAQEMGRVAGAHREGAALHEVDLLRAAGAPSKLGMQLGPYHVRHYDCDPSFFRFLHLRPYACPVEIKKRSSGFKYQILRYKPLPRAVVLCARHDLVNVPEHIDVVDLAYMAEYLTKQAS